MTTSLQLSDGADWYFRMRAVLSLAFICSFSIHAPSNTKLSVEHISRHSRLVTLCLESPFSFQLLIIPC